MKIELLNFEIKGDKMPIAIYDKMDDFEVFNIQLENKWNSEINKIFADIVKALPSKAPVIIVFINKKLPKSYCFWARYLSTELNRVILISELIKYPETILFALHSLLETPLAHITRRVLYGSEREKATE